MAVQTKIMQDTKKSSQKAGGSFIVDSQKIKSPISHAHGEKKKEFVFANSLSYQTQ